MNPIELAASDSPLARANVGEKALLFLGLLVLAISLEPVALLPIGATVVIVAWWARVPWRLYGALVLAPATFILLGIGPLIVAVTPQGFEYLGWQHAAVVLVRSVVGMAATMLFALTTPLSELMAFATRMRIPRGLIEVVSLMYRFVGMLMTTAKSQWEAQDARLGHSSLPKSIKSAGMQAATMFVLTFIRARSLQEGLELRGDPGDLGVQPVRRPVRIPVIIGTFAAFAMIVGLSWWR